MGTAQTYEAQEVPGLDLYERAIFEYLVARYNFDKQYPVRLTQQELADLRGMSREKAGKALNKLESLGLIYRKRRYSSKKGSQKTRLADEIHVHKKTLMEMTKYEPKSKKGGEQQADESKMIPNESPPEAIPF